jgi:GH35 family endo-1,4-beta-xylanase
VEPDWAVKLEGVLPADLRAKDRCVLRLTVRLAPDQPPRFNGEGICRVVVERRDTGLYEKALDFPVRPSSEWEVIEVGFLAASEVPSGKAGALMVCLGATAQAVEVREASLQNFGRDYPLERLPRPKATYAGRHDAAAWRAEARERIERIRKADFEIELRDERGDLLAGQPFTLSLHRHAFGFGASVKARLLASTSEEGKAYREAVGRLFSKITLENDLKPEAWNRSASDRDPSHRLDWTKKALEWARDEHLPVRGHYLAQGIETRGSLVRNPNPRPASQDDPAVPAGGPDDQVPGGPGAGPVPPFLPRQALATPSGPLTAHAAVFRHLRSVLEGTEGQVQEWDAINHLAGWHEERALGRQAGAGVYGEIMREARMRTKASLWVSEDHVFSSGKQAANFQRRVEDLRSEGVPPDGLALMMHLYAHKLPAPERLLIGFDDWSRLVPRLQISEFSLLSNGDEALKADYLRDALIAAFSHPKVEGFILWSYWDGNPWKLDASLWTVDWQPKPAGRVWEELVGKEWRTQVEGKSTPAGRLSFRGFHGLYEVRCGERRGWVRLDDRHLQAVCQLSPVPASAVE